MPKQWSSQYISEFCEDFKDAVPLDFTMSCVKTPDGGPKFTDWNGIMAELFDLDAVCTADVHPDSSSGIASDSGNYTPCEHFGNSGDSDSYPSSSHWGHSPPRTAKQDRTYWDDRRSPNTWRQGNMCQTPRDGLCKGQLQPRYSPVGYYPRDCFTPNGPGPPPGVDITGYTQFPPQGADYLSGDTGKLYSAVKKRTRLCYFDYLPDDVVIKIFSGLNSDDLCRSSRVCRRWYQLVWDVSLWTTIRIHSSELDIDKALKVLTKKLSMDTPTVCVMVERIDLSHCTYLTDKGLHVVAKRCPELRHLVIQGCPNVTNIAVFELVSRCVSLETLNVAGCACITCICLTPEATVQASTYGKQVYLRYLDMSECPELDDAGLQMVAAFCSQLTYLYLRHCSKISDIGVQYVANYCVNLREFSITDCFRVTDFGIRELAKLGNNLRYLSIAKCDKVSDVGMKQVVKYCRKLRYLNMRGCEAVSDETIERLGQCCRRLRSLDIGKCDITDHSLHILAENCPQLKKLSLKGCDGVTDEGVMVLARSCRQLQQLNIQDCHLSVDAYRVVRKYCQKCFIEHTNPGFF